MKALDLVGQGLYLFVVIKSMHVEPHTHLNVKALGTVVALGLAARVAVSVVFGENSQPYYEYMTIAQNLLDGKGYSFDEWGRAPLQPSSFLPPMYVYWCALFMGLFPGQYLWMYLAQAFVQASGCIPAYLIGKKLFSQHAGIGFAVAFAFYPEFVFTHSRPVSEFMYLVSSLWMVALYLEIRDYWDRRKSVVRESIVLGLLTGVSILTKEGALILAVSIGVAVLWKCRPRLRAIRRVLIPYSLAAAAVLSPWIIRNYVVQSEFIPVRTGYGLTFWLANHHGATGTDKTMSGEYVLAKMDSTYLARINDELPDDVQDRDRYYKQEGRRFISDYPAEYVSLCLKRLLYFVWFDPTHPIAKNLVYRASYVLLLLLAIPGMIWAWRNRKFDPAIALAMLGYLALYVPVIVLPRYRIISVLFLVMFAGVTLANLWHRIRPRKA